MIFVERMIRGDLEAVWDKTQDPKLHERWDLRFSAIEYVPKGEDDVQRFTYTTRLGFGLTISGWGESVGTRLSDGKRTSALKFGSAQRTSLIKEGSGYWQYEQAGDLVRFHTVYDYRVRFGWPGHVFDSLVFRPMIAWATALSFDRLGLSPCPGAGCSRGHVLQRVLHFSRGTTVRRWYPCRVRRSFCRQTQNRPRSKSL